MGGGDPSANEKDHVPRGWAALAARRACRDAIRVLDKVMDYVMVVFQCFMKILGPCLMCLAVCLIGFVTYTYFVHYLPHFDTYGVVGQGAMTSVGLFFVTNTLYNYGKASFMDPGTPPDCTDEAIADFLQRYESETGDAATPKKCTKCIKLKPPRCHHCSICQRCVLKMDHHCPWINNCVGHGNYRHFCLFMLFLAMSCAFVVVNFWGPFRETLVPYRQRTASKFPRSGRQLLLTSFMICCSILVALSILGGFHIYLVLTNQTTIEFQTNLVRRRESRKTGELYRNPYDLGRSRNFQQVFGPNSFCQFRWLLPYLSTPPTGDGLWFPSLRRLST
eukprot:TRINITY_DN18051_c0_g1_i1.p1 TRINITY_DN18051_c0_g1~~TRINITY_DN18051_c0_g1_i1.p1  ORF type:complete len:370 (-),score=18.59 TRINITY_DN18051_c0_g1_i1:189-1190(-)